MNLRQKQCAGSGMNCALLALAELSLLLFLSLQLLLSLLILLVQGRYQREQKLPSLLSPPKLPIARSTAWRDRKKHPTCDFFMRSAGRL